MTAVRYEAIGEGLARIVIDRPDDRVNALDPAVIEAFAAAVAHARAERPRGLVVASGKPDQFVSGADLKLVRQASAAELTEAARASQRILDDLASLPCTTVAAINGTALGGGCEIALACDWRIAADSPLLRIGQPEVQLGIIPASGGTQRLPRLVGLPKALDLILTGRRLTARRALRLGLVDEVVHPAVLERAALELARTRPKRKPEGGATPVERAATWLAPARAVALAQARKRVLAEAGERYPAPLRALEAIEIGLRDGFAAGEAAEAQFFGGLASSETARNLIAILFLTLHRRQASLEGLPQPRPVRHLGVVGLGFMGSGIAQAAAASGMSVRGRDVDHAAVARGLAATRKLTEEGARKGVFERREAARIVGRISGAPDLSGFRLADLVLEAVFEDLDAKRRVVAEIEGVVRDDCVIASNTSAIPIAEIARDAGRPERVVGMHFFSPVHRMQLLEVVRPAEADLAAVATAVGAGQAMGKTVIVVRDGPGFYTTRTLGMMLAEAALLLEEGARIEDVDARMKDFGWPVGPFTLFDEVGLPVALHAGETVAYAKGVKPPKVVSLLVKEGYQGKRGGAGFYRYDGKKRAPNPRVHELLGAAPRPGPFPEDVAERLTLAFANEAARCLDEEVLRSPAEGDLGAVLGLGFPAYLGGPFRYADARGPALRDALRGLRSRHGDRFALADSLAQGRRYFQD